MNQKWKIKNFGECAELIKESYKPSITETLPYIGLEHIEQQTLQLKNSGHSSETISNKFKFKKGDILFGKLRPYFRKVICPDFDGVCSTDIFVVRAKKETDQKFLFYWMASKEFVQIANNSSTGTRMPRADWDFLCNIQEEIPKQKEQKIIAEKLWILDEKIKISSKGTQNIEKTIQSIFKSWFIDFDGQTKWWDSELGMIPKGWKVKKLEKICDIFSGGTPSTSHNEYWNGEIFWLSSGETRNRFIIDTERKITQSGINNSSTRLGKKYDIVIASAGQGNTRGQVSILFIDSYINQSVIALRSKNEYLYSYFIFCNLKSRYNELRRLSDSHSSRGSLPKNLLEIIDMIVPDNDSLKKFNEIINPMFLLIENNLKTLSNLLDSREVLLPKLMSGEIKITV